MRYERYVDFYHGLGIFLPMGLNIKNPVAHALAEQVAAKTGQSLTEAVIDALREKLARLDSRQAELAREILALGADCAARLPDEVRELDHGTLLYDENGLPQ